MVEQAPYKVLQKKDKIEIRKYPKLVVASTGKDIDNSAFNLLFNYINGNNKSNRKISMTAPVITKKSNEKIPMTTPVISKTNYMAFVLPSSYSKENAPIPTNTKITIETIPERIIAVLQFSGRTNEKSIKKHTQILKKQVKKAQFQTVDDMFLMRYNSPFTPGFLRRNELAVELEKNEEQFEKKNQNTFEDK